MELQTFDEVASRCCMRVLFFYVVSNINSFVEIKICHFILTLVD